MKFATVGDNCIDHYIQTQNKYPGGNPVNVAVYIKRLGGQSSYTGLVGMDDFGSIIMDSLKKKGFNDASILKRAGRLDVYSASFSDENAANDFLKKFRVENPEYNDAWLLER